MPARARALVLAGVACTVLAAPGADVKVLPDGGRCRTGGASRASLVSPAPGA